MDKENILKKLKSMIDEGKDSLEIDNTLDNYRLPKNIHSEIFKSVQNYQLQIIREQQKSEKRLYVKILGWSLITFSVLIFTYSVFFLNRTYIIAYGALLVGMWVLIKRKFSIDMFDKQETDKKSMFDKGLFKKF